MKRDRYEFAQMIVVALLKLILDHDCAAVVVFGKQIYAKRARRLLPLSARDIEVQSLVEHIKVRLEPLSEVTRFVPPYLTQWNSY